MSALANTSSTDGTNHNLLANKARLAESISDLSVTTRIDYNLRFTKQAVLVVANNVEQYSQLASQFLVSLSNERPNSNQPPSQTDHINVAFVSASIKLNDIQIRCRLIEQLFVNTLFDPEESLAVSTLRLAIQQSEPITIVIDHAHALSLQVKYELSQLVNLAKKSKLTINVVLFGLIEAAQQLSENKSLFKSKMVLIDAESGQVLSFEDKKIAVDKNTHAFSLWQKLSLLGAMLLITVALIWLYLLIVDDVNQHADGTKTEAVQFSGSESTLSLVAAMKKTSDETINQTKKNENNNANAIQVHSYATAEDVLQALIADSSVKQAAQLPAQVGDVLQALVVTDMDRETEIMMFVSEREPAANQQIEVGILQLSSNEIKPNYYQAKAIEYTQGYVIQIAGFSDSKLWQRFIEQHSSESLFSYQRLLADKDFTVVTSKVYPNKLEAKAAILLLSAQLIERKPWLKPISSVINEINTFTR